MSRADKELRRKLAALEVPEMIVWIDNKMKVETTALTEKTIDEIMELIAADRSQLLERVLGELPKRLVIGEAPDEYARQAALARNGVITEVELAVRRLQGEGEHVHEPEPGVIYPSFPPKWRCRSCGKFYEQ